MTIIGKKAGMYGIGRRWRGLANNVVVPKFVGSMTTKGQIRATCRVNSTVLQAENSQNNAPNL